MRVGFSAMVGSCATYKPTSAPVIPSSWINTYPVVKPDNLTVTPTGYVLIQEDLGSLFGVAVDGLPAEIPANGLGGPARLPFRMHKFGDVSACSGSQLHSESVLNGVTAFLRPEDGHWDPRRAGDFYWCTTGASGGPGRLWRLRFDDILDPAVGGTIEMHKFGDVSA